MQRSLDHLPRNKQNTIRAIVQIIRDAVEVEMVILFGSFARGDYVEDRGKQFFSDYDLMVVVKSERLANRHTMWSQLRRHARRVSGEAPVSLIVHAIDDINQQLERGHYFFSDIKKEGILLFDSGRFTLAEEKESTPEERQAYAQACFDEYFQHACRLYTTFEFHQQQGWNKLAAFDLHQTTETCYKTVLLVFTAHLPKTHKLDELGKKCGDLHPAFRDLFPRATETDRGRFELLQAAYLDARYSMTYTITREDLEALAAPVRTLRDHTEQACRARIAAMTEA
jgi:HEPN domain-containing protein/predicted nucleotidyltransferase